MIHIIQYIYKKTVVVRVLYYSFKVQYVHLFKIVRKQHFDAIKRIVKMEDKGKTNEMIRTVIEKSYEPLAKAEKK